MRALALAAAVVAGLAAQAPQRDAPARQIPTGTGAIAGVLVSDDANAKPLRMASVTLSGAGLVRSILTVTDDEGRFAFRGLPAGRFTLGAEKPGYIEMDYGAVRPGGSGIPVEIEAGGQATIRMTLPKGAAISGTVTTPAGEPIAGARMFILQKRVTQTDSRQIGPPRAVTGWHWQLSSDDRGTYRFYGLPAGEYYILCRPSQYADARLLGPADFDWARTLLQPAASGIAPPPAPPQQGVSFAPVLFPGTADPAGAVGITVAAGEDRGGVDFPVPAVPTATITGLVVDPGGRPAANAQIDMVIPSVSIFVRDFAGARTGADGRFTVTGVLPGSYVFTARGAQPGSDSTGTPWALLDVNVDGHDISNLDVRLQPGMSISGRVVFAGTTATPPTGLRGVSVSVSPAGDTVMFGPGSTSVKSDGTFTIAGLSAGHYRLSAITPRGAGGAPSPWTMRSSVAGGVDVLESPLDLRPGMNVSDAVVTLTDLTTEIKGTMYDAAGKGTPRYFVVVFPTDRALWATRSRRVRAVRPGNTGAYTVTGLPAGEYFVCAVTEDADDLYTPAFLEPLISGAFRITLAEGEKRTQDLKVTSR